MPEREAPVKLRVERKEILPIPIQREGFTVSERERLRVHHGEESYTLYFREGNGERAETREWTTERITAWNLLFAGE